MNETFTCIVDSHHGVYIPQVATDLLRYAWLNPSQEDLEAIYDGPDSGWYWEAWENLLSLPVVLDGDSYFLHLGESGDLFLIPESQADAFFDDLI